MEALQCTEENTEAVIVAAASEPNRILKRNIGELAVDGKLNGMNVWLKCFFLFRCHSNEIQMEMNCFALLFLENFKSPARKEAKISHEIYLRRELEQWKELMKEKGIQNSVAFRLIAIKKQLKFQIFIIEMNCWFQCDRIKWYWFWCDSTARSTEFHGRTSWCWQLDWRIMQISS